MSLKHIKQHYVSIFFTRYGLTFPEISGFSTARMCINKYKTKGQAKIKSRQRKNYVFVA